MNSVPYLSDLPQPKAGEHLHIIESSGKLAQYVMRHRDGSGTYLGLAYTSRRPVAGAVAAPMHSPRGAPDDVLHDDAIDAFRFVVVDPKDEE